MGTAAYRIVPHKSGWGVKHDVTTKGPHETKEAAFEASVAAATSILGSMTVAIQMPPGSREAQYFSCAT